MQFRIEKYFWGLPTITIAWITVTSCYEGHGLDPTDRSGIRGTIHFEGQWPDSTKEVRLAVLKSYPEGLSDPGEIFIFVLNNLVKFSDPIPLYVPEYKYEVELDPDLYGWILVAWFPETETYIMDVKELGAYYKSGVVEELPTPVLVPSGEMVDGIDIIADFANVYNETPFF